MRQLILWLVLLVGVVGCGHLASSPATVVSSRTPARGQLHTAAPSIPLSPGWNGVAFDCQQLASLDATGPVIALAWWDAARGEYAVGPPLAATVNAQDGARRGFWVLAGAAASLNYAGQDDGRGNYVALLRGWNLVAFPGPDEVPGAALSATRDGASVPLSSVVLPQFQEIQADSTYRAVDVSAGGRLRPGRPYWVFATSPARLSWPSPGPSPVTSLTLLPSRLTLPVLTMGSLRAVGPGGEDVTAQAVWTSSEASVAAVVAPGVLKGLNRGQAQITATLGTVSAQAIVSVTDDATPGPIPTPDSRQYLGFPGLVLGTQNDPRFVAVGDFNADGRPDLATANAGSNSVSVLLASGAPGSFALATNFAAQTAPTSVAVGDFNADGRPDLAVTNGGSNSVSVLLASGAPGSFAAATNFATQTAPEMVAVGDFNADGRPDLAVANSGSNSVSVLLASGAPGSFAAATNFATQAEPRSLAVGDFNADGRPDLAVANVASNTVSVLLASGAPGNFAGATNFATQAQPRSVAVGDFNADGRPDLATADFGNDTVSVLLASGAPGNFAPATSFTTTQSRPYSVAVGDFNADGRPDLAVANSGNANVSVLLASGAPGNFGAATNFNAQTNAVSVAVGDFNSDGRPDLAVANAAQSNSVSVLLASGAPGNFAAATNFATQSLPLSLAVGDFNADGRPDLATANFGSNTVSVLLASGVPGNFAAATNFATQNSPNSVAVGDFNADGRPDLAVTNVASNTVSVLLASGVPGNFAAATNFATQTNPRSVAVGDFNADGRPDLAVANGSSNTVSVLLASGAPGNFAAATNFASAGGAIFVAVGDFNADSRLDMAVANGSATVWVLVQQ